LAEPGGVGTGFDIGGGVRAERPAGSRVCRHRAGLGYPAAVRPVRWPIRRVSRRRPVEPARTSWGRPVLSARRSTRSGGPARDGVHLTGSSGTEKSHPAGRVPWV